MTTSHLPKYLLAALAIILVVAAVIDVRTFTISNGLNVTVALLAPLYWWSIALALVARCGDPGRSGNGGVRAVRLDLLSRHDGRRRRQARGRAGAVVLAASTLKFLVIMSLAGGVVTVAI